MSRDERTDLVCRIRTEPRAVLRRRIVEGYPVDGEAIAGFTYRGTSLGLGAPIERLTWKTFQKTFWREPRTGRLLGWNVRLHQDGVDAPSRPKTRADGRPMCVWHYEVVSPRGVRTPPGFDRGLIIDYARGRNAPCDPVRLSKDPLVAVLPDRADLLLGVTYLALGPLCLETPTYFLLEREGPIGYVPYAHGDSVSGQATTARSSTSTRDVRTTR